MMGSMQAVLALSVGCLLGWRRAATVLAAAALGGAAVRRGMKMPGPAQTPGRPAAQPGDLPAAGRPPP